MLKRLVLAIAVATFLSPSLALAHGGGLDSSGCHMQNGVRHCPRDKNNDIEWCTVLTVAGALGAAWLIYEWIRDDDMSLAQPLRIAPYLTDTDRAGMVAEYEFESGHRVGFLTEHRMNGPQDETRFSFRWSVGF